MKVVTTSAAFELKACGKVLIWPPLAWGRAEFAVKQHGKDRNHSKGEMVGAARFELTTSCSQSRRSTRLSYAP